MKLSLGIEKAVDYRASVPARQSSFVTPLHYTYLELKKIVQALKQLNWIDWIGFRKFLEKNVQRPKISHALFVPFRFYIYPS